MRVRRRDCTDDALAITQQRRVRRRSENGEGSSDLIPIDLILEILTKLPAKSIAKCRCVSKVWDSMLTQPHFTERFLTKSRARPQILFACHKNDHLVFFSAPQIQNPDSNSSHVTATRLSRFPMSDPYKLCMCDPLSGLVCFTVDWMIKGVKDNVPVIFNPSTGQCLTLPKVKANNKEHGVIRFFKSGYDPIDRQFKVLGMTYSMYGREFVYEKHQVLTLGTGRLSWRTIECNISHHPEYSEICIDGVLYYPANCMESRFYIIVCFDVRYEKFSSITLTETFTGVVYASTLINRDGKLGLLLCGEYSLLCKQSESFELWVLEDLEKQKWSKHICVLPSFWKDMVGDSYLCFVGLVGTNEIVMSWNNAPKPFCLLYFNLERNTMVRVEIQGIDTSKYRRLATFLDHVENVKIM